MNWPTTRGETIPPACAGAKQKTKIKKNKSFLRLLHRDRHKKRETMMNLRTMKSNAVCNCEFIICRQETGRRLQRKETENRHRLKSNVVQEKKKQEHLNVQVDFQTFLLKRKLKSNKQTGRLPLILSYVMFILSLISVVL